MKGKNEQSQVSEPSQSSNEVDLSSRFLDVHDIARYLKLRTSAVYSLVEEKQIPHYRIGRQIRFRKFEVDQWMEEQKEPVVDAMVEARKVIRSLQRRPNLDVDRIVKKAIDEAGKKGYTSSCGKPDQVSDLRKGA